MIESKDKFQVVDNHFHELVELKKFVRTVQIGFGHTEELVSITNSMHEIAVYSKQFKIDENIDQTLKDAEELELFAKEQARLNHPYLYGLALIRIWSILEAFVDEVAISRLRNCDSAVFSKLHAIKMPIYEFISMDREQQIEAILNKFKESLAANQKKGNGRFKLVLSAVEVNGSVDDWVEKILLEMCEIRNSLVHRCGRVDKRLMESCPWIRKDRGGTVHVDAKHFITYWLTATWYLIKIKLALFSAYGVEPYGGDWLRTLGHFEERIADLKRQIEGSSTE